jgi:EAL domain-containing protein (putative c-di-GMP-specific phosphodiesterase class I)
MVSKKSVKIISELVKNYFEFSIDWYGKDEEGRFIKNTEYLQYYCIDIILGNKEYIIDLEDDKSMNELYEEIVKHWFG